MEISALIAAVGTLVALTNIITETLKQFTRELFSTNILALLVSELLTITVGTAHIQIHNIPFRWYMGMALLVGGCLVAYAAMFGFDKLKDTLQWRAPDDDSK